MIADLHCHYAMHLIERADRTQARAGPAAKVSFRDRLRAFVIWVANRVANFRKWSSGPRVTLDKLEQGGVRLVLSVLYVPLDEMDLSQPYGSPPQPHYFDDLLQQITLVENDLEQRDPQHERHLIVRRAQDLDDGDRVGFAHCVEGGFHLGTTPDEVRDHIAVLAQRGVLYITLAHLFWRDIATNAPALPFLSDGWYDRIFPQPESVGLSELGRAAVEAMLGEKILVDLSHMRAQAIAETLDLLDTLDPGAEFPVIATHVGARFPTSRQHYLLDAATIERVARRRGVIGLILAEHQLLDGVGRRKTHNLEQSIDVLCRHIDRVEDIAGPGHVGLGTDLDGFIKPTLSGLETAADLVQLRDPLIERYGDADKVDGVLYGNARRVIERVLAVR